MAKNKKKRNTSVPYSPPRSCKPDNQFKDKPCTQSLGDLLRDAKIKPSN